jgi:hypothetical protein
MARRIKAGLSKAITYLTAGSSMSLVALRIPL